MPTPSPIICLLKWRPAFHLIEPAAVPHDSVVIEPAATLVLLQDSAAGPQVLMQQRSHDAQFVGGAWVFPGGKLDAHDSDPHWLHHCDIGAERANRLLGTDSGALAYWVAALRESVEEAGLLLARQQGEPVNLTLAATAQHFLHQQRDGFLDFCREHNLTLCAGELRYLSRWVTPPGLPRRYDARFFLAATPAGQQPQQDDHEAINTCWVTPEQALERYRRKEWMLVLPTLVTLRQLSGYESVAAILSQLGNHIDAKTG